MKFLVIIALCVYAASAAPPFQYSPWQQQAKAVAQVNVPVSQGAYKQYEPTNKNVYGAIAKSSVGVTQPGFQSYKSEVNAKVAQPVVKSAEVVNPYQSVGVVSSNVGVKSEAYATSEVYKNAPEYGQNNVEVLRYDSEVNPDGFHYVYNTANGISAESSGSLKKVDDVDVLVVRGFYEYAGPDGTPIRVEYVADENGFQPKSDALPVAPAIPEAIARSLEFIAQSQAREVQAGKKF